MGQYPPLGRRGFGVSRAQGYGMDFSEYTKTWNESSIMMAQIESIGAVERIDEILAYKELDGVMVGPYDISGSLGIPGQFRDIKVLSKRAKGSLRHANVKVNLAGHNWLNLIKSGLKKLWPMALVL